MLQFTLEYCIQVDSKPPCLGQSMPGAAPGPGHFCGDGPGQGYICGNRPGWGWSSGSLLRAVAPGYSDQTSGSKDGLRPLEQPHHYMF